MIINFGNPGSPGVKYCLNEPCNNDGWEIQDKQLSKRDEVFFNHYRTSSGMLVASIDPLDIGDEFDRVLGEDENVSASFVKTLVDDEHWITDAIVEKVNIASMNGTTFSA